MVGNRSGVILPGRKVVFVVPARVVKAGIARVVAQQVVPGAPPAAAASAGTANRRTPVAHRKHGANDPPSAGMRPVASVGPITGGASAPDRPRRVIAGATARVAGAVSVPTPRGPAGMRAVATRRGPGLVRTGSGRSAASGSATTSVRRHGRAPTTGAGIAVAIVRSAVAETTAGSGDAVERAGPSEQPAVRNAAGLPTRIRAARREGTRVVGTGAVTASGDGAARARAAAWTGARRGPRNRICPTMCKPAIWTPPSGGTC